MNGYKLPNYQLITEVWAYNLEEEFERIRDVVEHYQYIAMDTEFPGIVARPTGNVTEYNYQTVKCNVDLLKVIQLGITFADARGNLVKEGTSTWQFNFRFDLERDMYAQDSIDFLKQSGIDFEKQQREGIDLQDFGELIMSSGLVMNEDVKWISFHGCYDFGYLLKLLTCAPLPHNEAQFFELLHDFFPALYDIKYLLRNIKNLNLNGGSSLQKIAEHLNVRRIGPQHQAGSDSLVTCHTFFKLMETYFDNQIDDSKYSGVIYGLGTPSVAQHSIRQSNTNNTIINNDNNDIIINNENHINNNDSNIVNSTLSSSTLVSAVSSSSMNNNKNINNINSSNIQNIQLTSSHSNHQLTIHTSSCTSSSTYLYVSNNNNSNTNCTLNNSNNNNAMNVNNNSVNTNISLSTCLLHNNNIGGGVVGRIATTNAFYNHSSNNINSIHTMSSSSSSLLNASNSNNTNVNINISEQNTTSSSSSSSASSSTSLSSSSKMHRVILSDTKHWPIPASANRS